MSDTTSLGDRMKAYENVTRYVLPQRTYTIIRVDGRAFHSYLRGADRPFDYEFMRQMGSVAAALCAEISGARFAYLQSDEVSVLATDFGSVHSEPWFGGVVQKVASVAASVATATLCRLRDGSPVFDGRAFTVSTPAEVANYFVWRQRDAARNSVSMAAQAHFPHKRLQSLNGDQMQALLWSEKSVNWNDYPVQARRGALCRRVTAEEDVTYTDKRTGAERTVRATRSRWTVEGAPRFAAEPGSLLAALIPALPALAEATAPASLDAPQPRSALPPSVHPSGTPDGLTGAYSATTTGDDE